MKPKSSLHWSGEDKVKLLCNPKKFLKFPSSWHCFEKTWAPALQRHHMIEGICKYGKWLMWDEGINSISLYHGYSNPYHAAYQPLIMLHTNLHLWYFRFVSWISNPTSLIWKKRVAYTPQNQQFALKIDGKGRRFCFLLGRLGLFSVGQTV